MLIDSLAADKTSPPYPNSTVTESAPKPRLESACPASVPRFVAFWFGKTPSAPIVEGETHSSNRSVGLWVNRCTTVEQQRVLHANLNAKLLDSIQVDLGDQDLNFYHWWTSVQGSNDLIDLSQVFRPSLDDQTVTDHFRYDDDLPIGLIQTTNRSRIFVVDRGSILKPSIDCLGDIKYRCVA